MMKKDVPAIYLAPPTGEAKATQAAGENHKK
jgi:hypothetical protein